MRKISTIVKIITKIVVAVLICVWLASFANGFAPIIGNDIALGQLENSDANFALMQAWTQLQNRIHMTQGGIGALCVLGVIYDVIEYMFTRKVD